MVSKVTMKLATVLTIFLPSLVYLQGMETGVRKYNRYMVYSVTTKNHDQYQILWDIYNEANSTESFDFWTEPVINGKTDVMVAPSKQQSFLLLLDSKEIEFEVKVEDVQSLVDEETMANLRAQRTKAGTLRWDAYARYKDIAFFVQDLPKQSKIASVRVIGHSYEGRDIYAVKISTSRRNRKAIFIDANIHGREWITSATATYILNEFVKNTSSYTSSHLNGIDYYILPNVNPDGYEFSHTSDRMWRKTRSVNPGSKCRGCDPNRNFPFKFAGKGTSSNPCSDTFKGSSALSESETHAVANYIQKLRNEQNVNILAYLSFHSYGQMWLLPWGYTPGAYPEDYADQLSLGKSVVAAIQRYSGTKYVTGSAADVLYGVGGASDDFAKSIGVKYTATVEMRDKGRHGFVLPPSQIVGNAKEILVALGVVARRIRTE